MKRDGSSRENKDRRKGKSREKGGKDCRNKWGLNKNNGGLSRDSCKDKEKGKKDKKIRLNTLISNYKQILSGLISTLNK